VSSKKYWFFDDFCKKTTKKLLFFNNNSVLDSGDHGAIIVFETKKHWRTMLKVRFPGKCLTPKQKSIVRNALNFYLDILVSKRLKDGLTIRVKVTKDLLETDSVEGDVVPQDLADGRRPREFDMRIHYHNATRFDEVLIAIAHETVHIKQFARSELSSYSSNNKQRFQGKLYSVGDDDAYWDLPWEIEAHGRERGLYMRYIQTDRELYNYCEQKSK
jgi:hypothetical protein